MHQLSIAQISLGPSRRPHFVHLCCKMYFLFLFFFLLWVFISLGCTFYLVFVRLYFVSHTFGNASFGNALLFIFTKEGAILFPHVCTMTCVCRVFNVQYSVHCTYCREVPTRACRRASIARWAWEIRSNSKRNRKYRTLTQQRRTQQKQR